MKNNYGKKDCVKTREKDDHGAWELVRKMPVAIIAGKYNCGGKYGADWSAKQD